MVAKPETGIEAPRRPIYDRDRLTDCRLALDAAFSALADAAEAAGWNGDEAAYTLLHLAGANLQKRAASAAFDPDIARANRTAEVSIKTPAAASMPARAASPWRFE